MIVRSPYNYIPFEGDVVQMHGDSKTVPDMTKSLKELLYMHAKGIDVPSFVGHYDEDDSMPDLRRMDLTEIDELKASVRSEMSELKEKLKVINKERQERSKPAQKPSDGLEPNKDSDPSVQDG